MSQVINLSEQDSEQLASFMGHTSDIHKSCYRLPNDVYQMAKVSKLLLLNEKGQAHKFKGKTLDDIEIDLDIVEEENSDEDDDEEIDFENQHETLDQTAKDASTRIQVENDAVATHQQLDIGTSKKTTNGAAVSNLNPCAPKH
ncbi:unnamed protein product [Phaedon cochleariae]|uniref:Uncharacterized protein n=1 Tax=Phaedon cochleariae TaxID=80249 RepID=A0A9P0GTQ2_PHACE|nr:unnamed protein product [Phaedon cochleariae]